MSHKYITLLARTDLHPQGGFKNTSNLLKTLIPRYLWTPCTYFPSGSISSLWMEDLVPGALQHSSLDVEV